MPTLSRRDVEHVAHLARLGLSPEEVTRLEGEVRELMKGDPLGGVHAFYSGSYREWWNPLLPNTRVARRW